MAKAARVLAALKRDG
jgi:hypothetical protein